MEEVEALVSELRARANARRSSPERSPTAELCAQAAATLERVEKSRAWETQEADLWSKRAHAAQAQVEAMRKALEEVRDLKPREKPLPADHWDQIRACPECQRYADHPVQRGICNDHRRPMWDQEKYEAHEERALGYRAKGIARDALSGLSAQAEESGDDPVVPALLEALKGMVDAYWRGSEDSDDEHAPAAVKAALAAIARAEVNG